MTSAGQKGIFKKTAAAMRFSSPSFLLSGAVCTRTERLLSIVVKHGERPTKLIIKVTRARAEQIVFLEIAIHTADTLQLVILVFILLLFFFLNLIICRTLRVSFKKKNSLLKNDSLCWLHYTRVAN